MRCMHQPCQHLQPPSRLTTGGYHRQPFYRRLGVERCGEQKAFRSHRNSILISSNLQGVALPAMLRVCLIKLIILMEFILLSSVSL